MQQQDYSNIEFIINWDENPVTFDDKGVAVRNQNAKQNIYSPISLPDGDWNIYVGKVIEKIYLNRHKQIVIKLRKPKPEDLSPENLNRQPLTASLEEVTAEKAETIRKPATQDDIIRMRRELLMAEQATQRIYGGKE